MTKFLDDIQRDCLTSEYYQCNLPNPEEQRFEKFYNNYIHLI